MKPAMLAAILGVAALTALTSPALAQDARSQPWTTLRATTVLPPPVETGRRKINGVELYYAIYGKGPPVVLLHPGLGNSDYWANQVGPLSQDYQVMVVDLRGHGRSTGSDEPLTYELMADDIVRLIKTLRIKEPVIVGWGDGAVVGLEIAMRYPKRISKLVAFGLTYDVSGQQPGVDQTQTFIDYVHKAIADHQTMSPQPGRVDATFNQLEALWATAPRHTAADLAKVKTPTAVIAAEYDEWVTLQHMEEAAGLLPDSQIILLHRTSHFAPWQAPKTFNDALKLVLKY
jgi:pimeloyl-ACP methyl ester carboxylesterase